jgi:hypothetical protein
MRLIFSRDRAAQLDLLLQSIERNMPPEETTVLWTASDGLFRLGYRNIISPNTRFVYQETEVEFDTALREVLVASETVTFFCDDDIVFRPVPALPSSLLGEGVLFARMAVGQETRNMVLPSGFPVWEWGLLEPHDFGFAGGVDGDTYRSHDVVAALGSATIGNPTWVETAMSMSFKSWRQPTAHVSGGGTPVSSLAACFPHQCVVGNAVNRVSPSSMVGYGYVFPQTAAALNKRFVRGERIDYDKLDFTGIYSCHHEILLQWK